MHKFHYIYTLLIVSLTAISVQAQTLRERFAAPSEEARPWCFWYWMYGAVSAEGITADLEAMKQAGLGGTYLMPIKSSSQGAEFGGNAEQLSPRWWDMVRHSMKEADRLGLKLGMHICDGFALAGGPWITPQESMQKVVWTDSIVSGGGTKTFTLVRPESYQGFYRDIAVLALPVRDEEDATPIITTSALIDTAGGFFRAVAERVLPVDRSYPDTAWIQYAYAQPFTCRNVEVVLQGNNYQAHRLRVLASDDGVHFRLVRQLMPARQGWQNTDAQSTHAIPATRARYFRFSWTPAGSEPGSEDMDAAKWKPNLKIKALRLSARPRLNQWEGKAGFVWRVAPQTTGHEIPASDCIAKEEIIDLTGSWDGNKLTARLPEGRWRILRMGHTATGHTNATGGGARGLECDKFSAATVRKQLDHWFGRAFDEVGAELAGRVLKYMHVDSWECGSQNWSENFAREFHSRRGYDLMPYLPLLAGIPVESAARSEEVLRDVRTTISELVRDVFYKELLTYAREKGCLLSAECVSPTMVSDGMLHYSGVDLPMGEFWYNSPTHDKPNDMADAISGAHVYGKNIIQAEGFTQIRGTWEEHPAMLKSLLDRNYALGVNRLFYHVYVHNPWLDRRPGMTLDGIGFFFQRDQTWWRTGASAFSTYAARCQALLQYGVPVTDIAVFTGEEMPRRAVLPDRLVPSLPGIFGAERVASERKRLANEGQPLRTIVGVTHSANMADPEQWVNPMRGYAYDSFNRDALLRLARVEGGRMVLPGGASYKVFVLPLPHPMSPDALELSAEVQGKIDELKRGGVVVPALPYTAGDFSAYGLTRDVEVPSGIAWTHRRGAEADIYFLANQENTCRTFTVSLRDGSAAPELWNPVNGEITSAAGWEIRDGRLCIELTLDASESVFVVCPRGGDSSLLDKDTSSQNTDKLLGIGGSTSATMVALKPEKSMAKPVGTTAPLTPLGNWTITFNGLGNKTLIRTELFDWSKEADSTIRHYSGTAVYSVDFRYRAQKGERVYLCLTELHDIAAVRVNGIDCGTIWTAPFRIDITHALKKGRNRLTLEVTNTWANTIHGMDSGTPPFEGIWTNAKYRMTEKKLLPAGVWGAITLETIRPNN